VQLLLAGLGADASGGVADAEFGELSVEGGSADPEATGNFGHAAAIMADGKPDDVGFDGIERAHIAVRLEQGHARAIRAA
jgi:hypothetical protein